jgi:hypothetical protein
MCVDNFYILSILHITCAFVGIISISLAGFLDFILNLVF